MLSLRASACLTGECYFSAITNNAEVQAAARKPTGAWLYFKLTNSEWVILSLKEFVFLFFCLLYWNQVCVPGTRANHEMATA